jgi:hypothetical protein
MRPIKILTALALMCATAVSSMALPNASAIKPAAGYATVTVNNGNPLDVTVKATKPGYGVFWVAITSSAALTPASNSLGWDTTPDKDGAVWRTNTGAKGNMLIPAGQSGYAGFPQSGVFIATVTPPKKGATPVATNVDYVIHVIDLATGNTFWAKPGGGNTPPPPPSGTPPAAQDDCTLDVTLNTPITINVLQNDLPLGDTFTIASYTQPAHGTVVKNANNTFTYTPNNGYVGSDTFTYTIANGAACPDPNTDPYTLTSTLLANGDVHVVLRQSRNVVDNTYGTNSSPGYPRQGEHWFKDLVNSDHARFVLKNANGQTVLDFYLDYLSASSAYPSGYGTLGVSGGDGSISVGSASNITNVTTTMTTNLNQSPAFYSAYLVNSPAEPNANWEYVDGYSFTVKASAFGASGFGSVTSPDVHNSPAKKDGTTPSTVPCLSTATVCLNIVGTPPPPDCAGILLFGPDDYLTTDVKTYLVSQGVDANSVFVYKTPFFGSPDPDHWYVPNALQTAINAFKAAHNGLLPCAMMFDPEYFGPGNVFYGGLDANDQALLKQLVLGGMGLVYAEPYTLLGNPLGQLWDVLPVESIWSYEPNQRYEVIDLGNPITAGLPGLTQNTPGGLFGWNAGSGGQNDSLSVESLTLQPVAGVQYANRTPLLSSSPSGYVNSWSLDYQPAGGPTAAQPGGRVVVLGTDTYFGSNGTVSPTNLALYYNALNYAAGN